MLSYCMLHHIEQKCIVSGILSYDDIQVLKNYKSNTTYIISQYNDLTIYSNKKKNGKKKLVRTTATLFGNWHS